MKTIGVVVLALIVTAAMAAAASAAQPASVSEPQGQVILGNLLWMFRANAGGMSPGQRADQIDARSVEVLSDPSACHWDVRIVTPRGTGEPQIMVGRHLFATVTRADARANFTTPTRLASIWARHLDKGLAISDQYRTAQICYLRSRHEGV